MKGKDSKTGRFVKGNVGGRITPNKITSDVRKMILAALEGAGGQKYLQEQATANPTAFLTLIGKIVPKEITGMDGAPLVPTKIKIELIEA